MQNAEQRQIELFEVESSQRQHHQEQAHYEKMIRTFERSEYNLFSMLKPELKKDGNQWCCLYGSDLQSGIAGFGDTPHLAVLSWNKSWNEF